MNAPRLILALALRLVDASLRLIAEHNAARSERHTCPRRFEVAIDAAPFADTWRRDAWHPLRLWKDRLENKLADGKRFGGMAWPAGELRPRTCSYCGGVNPEDVIALVLVGWSLEHTDKRYKVYAHPPGYREHVDAMLAALTDNGRPAPVPSVVSPVPPVKIYLQHFTDSHRMALADAVERREDLAGAR